jgi:glyoxalase family protein
VDNGRPGTLITYFEHDPNDARNHYVKMGAGQTHHYAFGVADEDTQLAYRERLIKAGYRVSPVMDRVYFKSIYTNDPDGHIVEIATAGPGFLFDEEEPELGQNLKLPPWLEQHRAQIENHLTPLVMPSWQDPEVGA